MIDPKEIDLILGFIQQSIINTDLKKITISGPIESNDLKRIACRPVVIKQQLRYQIVYSYQTKDITKNYSSQELHTVVRDHLSHNFKNISVIRINDTGQYEPKKKKFLTSKNKKKIESSLEHDKVKRFIIPQDRPFLSSLGIVTSNQKVSKSKLSKYKQINRFIEALAPEIQAAGLQGQYKLVDMGSGKGYLTFALHDYLLHSLGHQPRTVGIELRPDLVDFCNRSATALGYKHLAFKTTDIADYTEKMDILMSLHACDTATDDSIAKGIRSNARLIICSPCCHKEIRSQLKPRDALDPIHGILRERLSELITDQLRSLLMELHGYKVKMMEFISTEHTPKNLLIIATRRTKKTDTKLIQDKIQELKDLYGIQKQQLETLLSLAK